MFFNQKTKIRHEPEQQQILLVQSPICVSWLINLFKSWFVNLMWENKNSTSTHIWSDQSPKVCVYISTAVGLVNTHHHILEGFGDDERHAPVGEDAHSAGEAPRFNGENLWHHQPRDRTPTQSKTWTQQQLVLKNESRGKLNSF